VIALRVCALGDLVLTGPLLERLREPYLVAHAEHVALARAAGWVSGGIDADLAGLHALHAAVPEPARLAPALRARLARAEPVLVISRPGPACEALVRGLRAAGGRDVCVRDPYPPQGMHAADHLAAAVAGSAPAVPRIALSAERQARGRGALRALGLQTDGELLAIHPGAGSPGKRWPASAWAQLARELAPRAGVVVIQGPADEMPARALGEQLGAPRLAGLALVDLAAALGSCAALLGHDSGISHLAAALGVPTLSLFGPTDPASWAPRGPHVWVLRAPDGELGRLDPAGVLRAARALLQTSSR
jgi:heptosyltransferase-2